MVIKIIVILLLVSVLYCLLSAGFLLAKKEHRNKGSMVKMLTWRISLSVFLFLFLLVSFTMGWITPHVI